MDSRDFSYFGFQVDDNSLVIHTTTYKEPAYAPIDLATLVQEQPFCRQIRESIDEGQHIPFHLGEDRLLQRTIHSKSVVTIPNFFTTTSRSYGASYASRWTPGRSENTLLPPPIFFGRLWVWTLTTKWMITNLALVNASKFESVPRIKTVPSHWEINVS